MPESRETQGDARKADELSVTNETRRAASVSETAPLGETASLASAASAALPNEFGRYRVLRPLGKGQMGVVYLAHDTQLDRAVALKVARVSSSGSAKLIKRMETEAKAAANLDHPSICKVFDFGEIDGIRFIALQYIEGEDLKTYLGRVGKQRGPEEAVRLILQIAGAMEVAQEKGVIHRDLKPENVMLNKKGDPVVMDFGLARRTIGAADAGLTQGMVIGSAAYMSPEQASGRSNEIDHRSDLYALGVMLFEMLTGEWPFTGNAMEVMGRKCVLEPPSPLSINPSISDRLADVCQKMIAKKKEDRYSTFAEVITALQEVKRDDRKPIDTTVYDLTEHVFDPSVGRPKASKPRPPSKIAKNPKPAPKPIGSDGQRPNGRLVIFGACVVACVGICAILMLLPSKRGKELAVASIVDSVQKPAPVNEESKLRNIPPDVRQIETPASSEKKLIDEHVAAQIASVANETRENEVSASGAEGDQAPEIMDESEPLVVPGKDRVELATRPTEPTLEDLDNLIKSAAALVQSAKDLKGKEGAVKFKEATITLKKASNLFPKDARPPFYLGLLYSGIGINDADDAAFQFKRVLERSPGHISAMNNLALVSIKARKFPVAMNFLGQAGSGAPRPFEVNQNLGRLINQATLLQLKKEELKRANGLNTQGSVFRSDTGWMYMPFDESEKAREEYKPFSRESKLEDQSCSICSGYAGLPCEACNREGAVLQSATAVGSTTTAFGTLFTYTPSATTLTCRVCRGTGRVDCPACKDGRDPNLRRR